MSKGATARLLGVTLPCVIFWEAGQRCPSMDKFQLLRFHCGITFDEWARWWRDGYGVSVETDEG
jgi:hypothetical protein